MNCVCAITVLFPLSITSTGASSYCQVLATATTVRPPILRTCTIHGTYTVTLYATNDNYDNMGNPLCCCTDTAQMIITVDDLPGPIFLDFHLMWRRHPPSIGPMLPAAITYGRSPSRWWYPYHHYRSGYHYHLCCMAYGPLWQYYPWIGQLQSCYLVKNRLPGSARHQLCIPNSRAIWPCVPGSKRPIPCPNGMAPIYDWTVTGGMIVSGWFNTRGSHHVGWWFYGKYHVDYWNPFLQGLPGHSEEDCKGCCR